MHTQTPWPTIWSRALRSSNAVARHNALAAARVLHERRIEREGVENYLAHRYPQNVDRHLG